MTSQDIASYLNARWRNKEFCDAFSLILFITINGVDVVAAEHLFL